MKDIDLLISIRNVGLKDKNRKTTLQEVLKEIYFPNFLKQVDGKNWRVHLQVRSGKEILESMITEGNKQKRAEPTRSLLRSLTTEY